MTMTSEKKKTAEEYLKEAKECLNDINTRISTFGSLIAEAEEHLPKKDYDKFIRELRADCGLSESDIKAAVMIHNGELDVKLFFSGVGTSKILNLKSIDRERLLTEKFKIRDDMDEVKEKYWHEMSVSERNRLLGPKGGSILSIDRQKFSKTRKSLIEFNSVSFNKGTLTMKNSKNTAEVELGMIVRSLKNNNQLNEFSEELQRLVSTSI